MNPALSVQFCVGPHSPWYVVSHVRVICSPSTKLPNLSSALLVVSVHVSPGSEVKITIFDGRWLLGWVTLDSTLNPIHIRVKSKAALQPLGS